MRILERLGHVVLSDHVLERDPDRPETFVIKSDSEYFEYMTARIRSSDLLVADVSYTTSNIGYEISYALSNNVPVLALYSADSGNKGFPLLLGNQSPILRLCSYTNETIERIIKSEVTKIQDSKSIKFTILINDQIASYLDWVARKTKSTRSSFIKQLIETSMLSDKSYKKSKAT